MAHQAAGRGVGTAPEHSRVGQPPPHYQRPPDPHPAGALYVLVSVVLYRAARQDALFARVVHDIGRNVLLTLEA